MTTTNTARTQQSPRMANGAIVEDAARCKDTGVLLL
jgi:hypothetical protein